MSSGIPEAPARCRCLAMGAWLWLGSTGIRRGANCWKFRRGGSKPGRLPKSAPRARLNRRRGFARAVLKNWRNSIRRQGFCEERLYVYLATDLIPSSQNLDHDELIEIVCLPLTEAVKMIERGEIEDSKTIVALLMAEKLKS